MIVKIREEIILPLEIDQTYNTKFGDDDKFKITNIKGGKITGIYTRHEHLGECPIGADRLIPIKVFTGNEIELDVCPVCKKQCNCTK